ncbi:YodC family protein [Blastochloris viridis]|uniref:Putative small protein n=1 Tax=Blastochloris viridis TaxID=1079 RepID=A0A0H5BFC7_BLAVI|nr:DUF2158 domain-containing protein [Blastochloris viridis]ALK10254.1 hypothetical protein BVIR_2488 [Blastochloris viridis]BAR99814.1 hypothetical protein BV133_2221 [Blastochloris viridis]CUU42916.1 putative small protein [Blastochloris viridis]
MKFEVGDIVQLKSGGPLLTVSTVDKNAIHCVYFSDEAGEFRTYDFAPALIVHVEIEDAEEEDEG